MQLYFLDHVNVCHVHGKSKHPHHQRANGHRYISNLGDKMRIKEYEKQINSVGIGQNGNFDDF